MRRPSKAFFQPAWIQHNGLCEVYCSFGKLLGPTCCAQYGRVDTVTRRTGLGGEVEGLQGVSGVMRNASGDEIGIPFSEPCPAILCKDLPRGHGSLGRQGAKPEWRLVPRRE